MLRRNPSSVANTFCAIIQEEYQTLSFPRMEFFLHRVVCIPLDLSTEFAIPAADRTVCVYNLSGMSGVWRKLGPSKDSPGHAQGINDLAWSTDSRFLCTAIAKKISIPFSLICTVSDDRTLRIWDANRVCYDLCGHSLHCPLHLPSPLTHTQGTQLSVMKEHQAAAMSVAVNPQGNMIATGSWDEMVRIWDIRSALTWRLSRHLTAR